MSLQEVLEQYSDDLEKVALIPLLVKDVNRIPVKAYNTVYITLKSVLTVLEVEDDAIKQLSLTVCQYLSLTNMLICNAGDREITQDDINKLDLSSINFTNFIESYVDNYEKYHAQIEIRELFVKEIASYTDDQDVLTCATNFIFYHSQADSLSDNDKVHRDLALINLIKFSIKFKFKDRLGAMIADMGIDLKDFISEHIDMFIS